MRVRVRVQTARTHTFASLFQNTKSVRSHNVPCLLWTNAGSRHQPFSLTRGAPILAESLRAPGLLGGTQPRHSCGQRLLATPRIVCNFPAIGAPARSARCGCPTLSNRIQRGVWEREPRYIKFAKIILYRTVFALTDHGYPRCHRALFSNTNKSTRKFP